MTGIPIFLLLAVPNVVFPMGHNRSVIYIMFGGVSEAVDIELGKRYLGS